MKNIVNEEFKPFFVVVSRDNEDIISSDAFITFRLPTDAIDFGMCQLLLMNPQYIIGHRMCVRVYRIYNGNRRCTRKMSFTISDGVEFNKAFRIWCYELAK